MDRAPLGAHPSKADLDRQGTFQAIDGPLNRWAADPPGQLFVGQSPVAIQVSRSPLFYLAVSADAFAAKTCLGMKGLEDQLAYGLVSISPFYSIKLSGRPENLHGRGRELVDKVSAVLVKMNQ